MSVKTRKAAVVTMAFLLILLYFSKSIVYWTTPKVTATSIQSGSITYSNKIIKTQILSDAMESVNTPATLPTDLRVSWLAEGGPRTVAQGEALLRVDEVALKKYLMSAENQYYEALVTLSMYQKNYAFAIEDATKALEKADAALEKEPKAKAKRKKQLQDAFDTAYETYHEVVTLGIYQMTSLNNMKEQCAMAKDELDKYQTIYDNQCALLSPCDGTLISWPDKNSIEYLPANTTLFKVLPNDGAWQFEVYVEGKVYLDEQTRTVKFTNPTAPLDALRFTVNKLENKEEQAIMVLTGEGVDIARCYNVEGFTLIYNSPFYSALVPNNAFITDTSVYAVQNVFIDNRQQTLIEEIQVKKSPGNAFYTPVVNALSSNMLLVTSWDRDIFDGSSVIVIEQ